MPNTDQAALEAAFQSTNWSDLSAAGYRIQTLFVHWVNPRVRLSLMAGDASLEIHIPTTRLNEVLKVVPFMLQDLTLCPCVDLALASDEFHSATNDESFMVAEDNIEAAVNEALGVGK